jgi:hypothetical protein
MAETLKNDVLKLIASEDDTIVNLKNILMPISQCIDSPVIVKNISDIVDIMTADRNGDNKLDVEDLRLMVSDPFVIVHLVTSLILILTSLPQLKITVNVEESEIIILKLLIYVFLVIVPTKTGNNWKPETKVEIINISISVFNTMQSLQIVKTTINKIAIYVKGNKYCKCLTIKSNLIDDKVPDAQLELTKAINNVKEKKLMNEKIANLEKMVIQ